MPKHSKTNELTKDGGECSLGISEWDLTFSELLNSDIPIDTSTERVNPLQVLVVDNLILQDRA